MLSGRQVCRTRPGLDPATARKLPSARSLPLSHALRHGMPSALPAGDAWSYPLALLVSGAAWPPDVAPGRREAHLASGDFEGLMGMTYLDFRALPQWRQEQLKRAHQLF